MIRAIVCGAAGRMAGRMVALVHEAGDFRLVGAVEKPGHPALGRDAGEVNGVGRIGVSIIDDLSKVAKEGQVFFDFTTPEAAISNLEKAANAGLAAVIGTTGLSQDHLRRAKELSTRIPCVISPNMSVGVNLLFKILQEVAAILGNDYDVEIYEAHHRLKRDAPSGTALKMAQLIAQALKRDLNQVGVYGRKGMVGERRREEIGIHTIRAGDIVGDHTVVFGGLGERIEITHRAHSRDTFGRGALRAARWVVQQKPGLYDMLDVLGLK